MVNLEAQRAKAELLRRLHDGPDILVLANPWDAGSARIFEQAGCRALGTTSAGIAFAHGYADGEQLSLAEMLEAVRRIAAAVAVPVTADMEAGFGDSAGEVVETVRGVLQAGAVGVNLEDAPTGASGTLFDISLQVEKIRAVRELAAAEGIPLVINARTDVYLDQIGAPESRFDHAVERANAYRDAGADCLYVPGVRDAETIQRLVQAIRGPLNILAGPDVPPVAELARLGIRRLSVGSGPMRATLGLTERIARELLDHGTYTAFTEGALPYAEANKRFRR